MWHEVPKGIAASSCSASLIKLDSAVVDRIPQMKELCITLNRHPDDQEKGSSTAHDVIRRAYNSKPPGSWSVEDSFSGDCHIVVNELLGLIANIRELDGWTVTQADIPGGQGWHSWLEYDDWVVDFASGIYTVSNLSWYYENKKPSKMRSLKPQEFWEKWKTSKGQWWLSNPPKKWASLKR
jgi:hypothetical protein